LAYSSSTGWLINIKEKRKPTSGDEEYNAKRREAFSLSLTNERKALPVLALPRDPAQHLKEKGKQTIADAIKRLFSLFSFVVLAFLCPLAGS
jgi:hypothetical protein